MMIDTNFSPGKVLSTVDGEAPVLYIAFSLQKSIEWLLCHGVHSMDIQMMKEGSHCSIVVAAKNPPTEMVAAGTTKIATLLKTRLLPDDCDKLKKSSGDWTVVEGRIYADQTISDYAFSIAEIVVNFFLRGARKANHQCAAARSLTSFQEGVSKADFDEMNENGYNATMKVRELP
jgi:hypothetical protein